MTRAKKPTVQRPFRIDYAGMWPGYALTRENAIVAAGAHVVRDGYTKATITDVRTGRVEAEVLLRLDRLGYLVSTAKQLRKVPRPPITPRKETK